MIYEMRTYTMYAGKMPEYLKAAETIGRPARGDNYGMNHGYWTSEFGQVNQIWHLWSYPSLDERERLRGELQKNPKWTGEYVPAIRNLIIRQDLQIWNAVVDYKQPTSEGNVYELRTYRTHLGQARPWANLMKEYLPAREQYSPIHGLWTGEFPQPNSVAHLWLQGLGCPHRGPCRGVQGPQVAGIPRQGRADAGGDAVGAVAADQLF